MARTSSHGSSAFLASTGAALVHRLGGSWRHDRGMCLCPAHADRSPSLSVRVGHSSLLFKCFAGCDILDILREIRCLCPEAIDPMGTPSFQKLDGGTDHHLWFRARARDLWAEACTIAGTPAESYLLKRALAPATAALRYHPRVPLGKAPRLAYRPALLAAVRERGKLVAVQRTFLDPDRARRARDLANPRRMLGRPEMGSVILAPATEKLGLAEGVETALSAMLLLDIPVWAVLGSERLARVAIPFTVKKLLLLPDNDKAGRLSAIAAARAHAADGRIIETLWPPVDFNDWNDVLRAGGKERWSGLRLAA